MRRWPILLCSLALLGVPGTASAATTIGSDLDGAPPTIGNGGSGTFVLTEVQTGSTGVAASPVDGVIVKWRVRYMKSDANPAKLALRVARKEGSKFRGVGRSATIDLAQAGSPMVTDFFPTRLAIRHGEFIGVDLSPDSAAPIMYRDAPPGAAIASFFPTLGEDESRDPDFLESREELLQAVVEPDADGDGFGDETQDNCPAAANPTQADSDGDGSADACDADDDNDGVSDADEAAAGTNPHSPDSDGDGSSDAADAFPTDATRSVPAPVLSGPSQLGTLTPGKSGGLALTGVSAHCPAAAPLPCILKIDVKSARKVRTGPKGKRGKARIVRFGSVTTSVSPGQTLKPRVKLSPAGLKALRRLKRTQAIASLRASSEQNSTAAESVSFTLRSRPRRG